MAYQSRPAWLTRQCRNKTHQRSLCSQPNRWTVNTNCYRPIVRKVLQLALLEMRHCNTAAFEGPAMQENRCQAPAHNYNWWDEEVAILLYVQKESFGSVPAKTSAIAKLKPFLEDDTRILRVGGRLKNAPIPFVAKHPAILPSRHHITCLIIRHYHLRSGHAGPERVLAEVRQRYLILKGRATTRRIPRSCLGYAKLRAKPQHQQMAVLPTVRVTPTEPPFTRVGVDYFGPFMVKRARGEQKRYGCLFTCLTTRAIHLEVAHTLDTDSFINAPQRFIARRGRPSEIRSANGTNFVGGVQELRRAMNEWNKKISDHLLQKNVKWIFNPPGASHMGGVWERQIRTVRSVLNSVLSQQAPDDEGLMTLFCCVESIVNGRPITKLSNDPKDPLPLTPNHLLLLRAGPSLPPGAFVKQDVYRHRWRQVQYLSDVFWSRWLKGVCLHFSSARSGYIQEEIVKWGI